MRRRVIFVILLARLSLSLKYCVGNVNCPHDNITDLLDDYHVAGESNPCSAGYFNYSEDESCCRSCLCVCTCRGNRVGLCDKINCKERCPDVYVMHVLNIKKHDDIIAELNQIQLETAKKIDKIEWAVHLEQKRLEEEAMRNRLIFFIIGSIIAALILFMVIATTCFVGFKISKHKTKHQRAAELELRADARRKLYFMSRFSLRSQNSLNEFNSLKAIQRQRKMFAAQSMVSSCAEAIASRISSAFNSLERRPKRIVTPLPQVEDQQDFDRKLSTVSNSNRSRHSGVQTELPRPPSSVTARSTDTARSSASRCTQRSTSTQTEGDGSDTEIDAEIGESSSLLNATTTIELHANSKSEKSERPPTMYFSDYNLAGDSDTFYSNSNAPSRGSGTLNGEIQDCESGFSSMNRYSIPSTGSREYGRTYSEHSPPFASLTVPMQGTEVLVSRRNST